ncbi:hypothetical protein G4Q83_17725 [Xanthomonas theicola]|nr:hypothetical protein G4Q83_17725 [Xanthomonas theicola]
MVFLSLLRRAEASPGGQRRIRQAELRDAASATTCCALRMNGAAATCSIGGAFPPRRSSMKSMKSSAA